ncbi:MAG: hypothetical protein JWM47_2471 [Acidimicrobiales bacterium]|nr:hypothetical protein [Acidimicrobiales bacterium]
MRVLRLGRTTAYGLASQWEATNGETGLPVVRFGRQLRVPLQRLEELAGGPLDLALASADPGSTAEPAATAGEGAPPDEVGPDGSAAQPPPTTTPTAPPDPSTRVPTQPPASTRRRRARPPSGGHPSLFGEAS